MFPSLPPWRWTLLRRTWQTFIIFTSILVIFPTSSWVILSPPSKSWRVGLAMGWTQSRPAASLLLWTDWANYGLLSSALLAPSTPPRASLRLTWLHPRSTEERSLDLLCPCSWTIVFSFHVYILPQVSQLSQATVGISDEHASHSWFPETSLECVQSGMMKYIEKARSAFRFDIHIPSMDSEAGGEVRTQGRTEIRPQTPNFVVQVFFLPPSPTDVHSDSFTF